MGKIENKTTKITNLEEYLTLFVINNVLVYRICLLPMGFQLSFKHS